MILAALVAPIVGPFTIWRVIGRAGNVEDCVWASHQMREWLRSRKEAETNAKTSSGRRQRRDAFFTGPLPPGADPL